jgi:hypothetical protein
MAKVLRLAIAIGMAVVLSCVAESGGKGDVGSLNLSAVPSDSDGDLLSDDEEGIHGCDAHNPDTDFDGLLDGLEVHTYGSLPLVIDTDEDGLTDGQEVADTDLDPGDGEDGGFFPDWELSPLGDPPDMDDDGLADGPLDWDSDGDGMPDGFEVMGAFGGLRPVPLDPQRDDAAEDPDGDGLSNLEEYLVLGGFVGNSPNIYLGHDVFVEAFSNVVVEIESARPYEIRDLFTEELLASWLEERDVPGYTDGAYYRWVGMQGYLPFGDPAADEVLTYHVQIEHPGTYVFELRHSHASANPSEWNFCYVRVGDGEWRQTESVGSTGQWVYAVNQFEMGFLPVQNRYDFDAGIYRVQIVHGATNNCLDRFHFYHQSLATPPDETAVESPWVRMPAEIVAWDFYSDPFNPDSDGDGMPDGYEVWNGLHPMDPIPSRYGEPVIRYGSLHHAGDADKDGLANWYEYSVRFLLDSEAFVADPAGYSNQIEGSTHPWLPDTDGDGLGDGEEINLFCSHPLLQDTDGDGLPDGSKLEGRVSEVNTNPDPAFSNHTDMAMNDMWVLSWPVGHPWPLWTRVDYGSLTPPPSPRWGAAGTYVGYTVVDGNRVNPRERDDGMYVGVPAQWDRPVGHSGVFGSAAHGRVSVDQVLLQNSTFVVFGGRDGPELMNEVWEYDFVSGSWSLSPLPLTSLHTPDAGVVDVAVATKTYNVDNTLAQPGSRVRPRPGSPPGFLHYDASTGMSATPIYWRTTTRPTSGATSVPNWDRSLVCGGWNGDHDYLSTDTPAVSRYYKSTDNTNIVIRHGWAMGRGVEAVPDQEPLVYDSSVWQWESDSSISVFNCGRPLTIGCRSDGAVAIASIVIQDILNDQGSWPEGTGMQAILHTTIQNPGAPFEVRIAGEMRGHAASEEFKIMGAVGQTPKERLHSNFLYGERTLAIPSGVTNDIDVTEIVRAAFGTAGYGELGFLFVGKSEFADQTATLDGVFGSVWLEIIITRPHYLAPYPMTGTRENTISVEFEQNASTAQFGNWTWRVAPPPYGLPIPHPTARKSAAMAYNATTDRFYLFGGVNGFGALGDTWHAHDGFAIPGDGAFTGWARIDVASTNAPAARWGHGMVAWQNGIVVFGGFDAANKPLGDVWYLDGPAGTWTEITFADGELPPPRGGACLGLVNGRIFMFGGTDGNEYFNDTWHLDTSAGKWTNIFPADEGGAISFSPSPSARAFAAHNNNGGGMIVFGGRTGTLPTARDTDGDLLDDGTEMDLGGPVAGRDPRANALLPESAAHNVHAMERLPYAFKRIGGMRRFGITPRPVIADFESLERHPDTDSLNQSHAAVCDLPMEGHHPEIGNHFVGGFDAYIRSYTNLWWHQYGGRDGDIFDARDVWELGVPHAEGAPGAHAVPSTAHGGRWCYGTGLEGNYPNTATMELYSPIMEFMLPSTSGTSTDPGNTNGFYLIFHEWLDLADDGDSVRVEAIRPQSTLQVQQRFSTEPVISLLGRRSHAANTFGEWRRVAVPLRPVANEPAVYLRFVLDTDGAGTAGGWYIDDVAVVQAGTISGVALNGSAMDLFGLDGTNALASVGVNGEDGSYLFGLVAAGTYRVVSPDTGDTTVVNVGQGMWGHVIPTLTVTRFELDLHVGAAGMLLSWSSRVGERYAIQCVDPRDVADGGGWTTLQTINADSNVTEFADHTLPAPDARLYRVVHLRAD